jgi:hypothetical protein
VASPLLKLLPPSRARLVKMVGDLLREAGFDGSEYDETGFRYRLPDGSVIFLANLFAESHLTWPWRRRAFARRFVRLHVNGVSAEPLDFATAAPQLLPGIRHAALFDAVRLHALLDGGGAWTAPMRPLGARLRVCLFVDSADSTTMVTDRDLKAWGRTFEDLLEIALANLDARSERAFEVARPGAYVAAWSDCYDPARVLLPGRLSGLDVQGDLVAFMPNWNCLFLTGADDDVGLAAGLALARRIVDEEPRATTALPLVRRGGEWMDLELPRGHALEPELRKARVLELARVYQEQTELMRRFHDRDGVELFAARYSGMRREEDDDYSSYCVWSKGVVALLPATEEVHFFDNDQPEDAKVVGRADWDLVRLHCGELMIPTDWALPRFRVEAFPTPEQLEALRQSQAQRDAARDRSS